MIEYPEPGGRHVITAWQSDGSFYIELVRDDGKRVHEVIPTNVLINAPDMAAEITDAHWRLIKRLEAPRWRRALRWPFRHPRAIFLTIAAVYALLTLLLFLFR